MIALLASIGFMFAVVTFLAGFRMVRRADHQAEVLMHRVNGYCTITLYLVLASVSVAKNFGALYLAAWIIGFILHMMKVALARTKYVMRYGSYMGAALLITWLIVIFTHLPS
ncbi:MAG: hypothetical protein HY890_07425 [Deltaproteobacteria bacterium]|nr:hypothetical protein [Deltaproteobacteria bacterium]